MRPLTGQVPLAAPTALYQQADEDAAREFEAFMVGTLAKQMRASVPNGPWSDGAMATFADLFDQEIGKRVAETGGFGLQEDVLKSLRGRREQSSGFSGLPSLPAPNPKREGEGIVARVTSAFGLRSDPFTGENKLHRGLDLAAPAGTPVSAAAEGVVRFAGKRGGYGNVVIVAHPDGTETRYAHLRDISVKRGAQVDAGENIATVGSTGRSTGPHLHFELRRNGEAVEPNAWLVEKGAQVLPGATESAAKR